MPRLVHIAVSFLVVLVAYWTYAILAVPVIEPPAPRPTQTNSQIVVPTTSGPIKELEGLFAPGDWESDSPQVLESDRAILLVKKYENQGNGWVDLFPFTVVLLPQGQSNDEAQRAQGAVVLQAPQGARLRFDKGMDLGHMKIGRLSEGKLRGPVTIRSRGKKPGPEDDLRIDTRDVEMTEQHIWTQQPVAFRWGPHFGSGQEMHIYLLPRDPALRGSPSEPNVGGMERFEIRTVDRLHLDLAGLPGGGKGSLPVEVTCRGPFQFNLVQQRATFRDQVDVLRLHPTGPSDQLTCELLSIFFTKAAKPATPGSPGKPRAGAFDLQPERIEALGHPAVLHAPANNVDARAERLQYNFLSGRIMLEDPQEVALRQATNEVHAPYLEYQTAPNGRVGRVIAKGPGWVRGQMAERPGESLEARWKSELLVQPEGDKQQLIWLKGGAGLSFRQIGQMEAQEIRFWLNEIAQAPASTARAPEQRTAMQPGAAQSRLQPDHMLAEGDVRINSPQLSSSTERLEIAFEQGRVQGSGAGHPGTPRGTRSAGRRVGELVQNTGLERQGPIAAGRQDLNPGARTLNPQMPSTPQPPAGAQHVEVVGRLMRAKVQVIEQKSELVELTVEGGARFTETQTAQPGEKPLLVTGERIHVTDANRPQTNVIVTGQPAHFEGRGLNLTGPNLNMNRGSNRVWIDGPGRMLVPLDRDMEGRQLARPGVMQVDWRRRMQFDGRTAQFEESVTASGPTQQLQTQMLAVQFQQPVRFSEPRPQQPPQVEQLLCRGGVLMENRTMQGNEQVSRDRMQAGDLTVNWTTGALHAAGPGWVVSVRRGGVQNLARGPLPQQPPGSAIPAPAATVQNTLNCLHLRFLGSIAGNVRSREMIFNDQVRAAYGSAVNWDTVLDVDNPSEQGGTLKSDHLQVNDMTPMGSGQQALEMLATGNVVAEGKSQDGKSYTARAIRMSYAQAKDLLVLEGDGRSDAELFLQDRDGGIPKRTAAQEILFKTQTHWTKIVGARSLEVNQFPGQPGKNQFRLPGLPGGR